MPAPDGLRHAGTAHQIANRSTSVATCLEVGNRQPGDRATYPRDHLVAVRIASGWKYTHKDGTPC